MTALSSGAEEHRVALAPGLLADLRELGDGLAAGSFTLSGVLVLLEDLRRTVTSLLGFSLVLTLPGPSCSVAMNVVDEPLDTGDAGDSLTVALTAQTPGHTTSVTFYSADEHALDGLRVEFAAALDLPLTVLAPPSDTRTIVPGITGLAEFSTIQRAVGVLLAAGHTRSSAETELTRQAHNTSTGLVGTAHAVLDRATSTTTRGRSVRWSASGTGGWQPPDPSPAAI